MNRPFDSVQLTCRQCQNVFLVPHSKSDGRFYCKKSCMKAYENEHGRSARAVAPTMLKCEQCQKEFGIKPGTFIARQNQGKIPRFCSKICSGLARQRKSGVKASDTFTCVECGKENPMRRYDAKGRMKLYTQQKYCDNTCKSLHQVRMARERFENGDYSKSTSGNGYIGIHMPTGVTGKKRRLLEHRFVMEQIIGRQLLTEETVHHVNGLKHDNRPENLRLFSSRHGPGQDVEDKVSFAVEMIRLYPEFARAIGVRLVECEVVPIPIGKIIQGESMDHDPVSTPP